MTANPNTVTRINPTETTDRYGDTVPDWGTVTETLIEGAVVAPQPVVEETDQGRRGVVFEWMLWVVDEPVELDATDRVRYAGDVYEVEGHPARWRHPRTQRLVTQAVLRRVEG